MEPCKRTLPLIWSARAVRVEGADMKTGEVVENPKSMYNTYLINLDGISTFIWSPRDVANNPGNTCNILLYLEYFSFVKFDLQATRAPVHEIYQTYDTCMRCMV